MTFRRNPRQRCLQRQPGLRPGVTGCGRAGLRRLEPLQGRAVAQSSAVAEQARTRRVTRGTTRRPNVRMPRQAQARIELAQRKRPTIGGPLRLLCLRSADERWEVQPVELAGHRCARTSSPDHGPNQVVSASRNPAWVLSPTQATCPSGLTSTADRAVTSPTTGSSQMPA